MNTDGTRSRVPVSNHRRELNPHPQNERSTIRKISQDTIEDLQELIQLLFPNAFQTGQSIRVKESSFFRLSPFILREIQKNPMLCAKLKDDWDINFEDDEIEAESGDDLIDYIFILTVLVFSHTASKEANHFVDVQVEFRVEIVYDALQELMLLENIALLPKQSEQIVTKLIHIMTPHSQDPQKFIRQRELISIMGLPVASRQEDCDDLKFSQFFSEMVGFADCLQRFQDNPLNNEYFVWIRRMKYEENELASDSGYPSTGKENFWENRRRYMFEEPRQAQHNYADMFEETSRQLTGIPCVLFRVGRDGQIEWVKLSDDFTHDLFPGNFWFADDEHPDAADVRRRKEAERGEPEWIIHALGDFVRKSWRHCMVYCVYRVENVVRGYVTFGNCRFRIRSRKDVFEILRRMSLMLVVSNDEYNSDRWDENEVYDLHMFVRYQVADESFLVFMNKGCGEKVERLFEQANVHVRRGTAEDYERIHDWSGGRLPDKHADFMREYIESELELMKGAVEEGCGLDEDDDSGDGTGAAPPRIDMPERPAIDRGGEDDDLSALDL